MKSGSISVGIVTKPNRISWFQIHKNAIIEAWIILWKVTRAAIITCFNTFFPQQYLHVPKRKEKSYNFKISLFKILFFSTYWNMQDFFVRMSLPLDIWKGTYWAHTVKKSTYWLKWYRNQKLIVPVKKFSLRLWFGSTHPCALRGGLTRAPEKFSPEKISIVLQEGQIKIPEKFHMLVFYAQFFRGVPVNHLYGRVCSFIHFH